MGGPWKADLAAAAQKRYRERHPERVKAIRDAASEVDRAFLRSLKAHPCMDCGRTYPTECMDFDHVRGEKLFTLHGAAGRTREAILAEVAKCDLVCANCHRIRTRGRGMFYPRKEVS